MKMTRPKFQRRNATQLPPGAIVALASGHDFFRAFSDGNPTLTQETLDRMREAWRDPSVREAVRQRQLDRWGTSTSFARLAFGETGGKRLKPNQVERVRDQYQELAWQNTQRNRSLHVGSSKP